MNKFNKFLSGSLLAFATLTMTTASSQAGWVLNPRLCPDLTEDRVDRIEDRVDRRHYNGPRDIREDRRDRRENRRDRGVTQCPARAFTYVNSGIGIPVRPSPWVTIQRNHNGTLVWHAPNGSVHIVVR